MKKDAYYTSGQFAKKAHVTLRAIRYYDKQNILKPSARTAAGARLYTDADLAKLQQILLLKYLGFSLDDIREMTINDSDYHFMANALKLQQKLVQDKIEQLQLVEKAIQDTSRAIEEEHSVNWSQMLHLIHLGAALAEIANSPHARNSSQRRTYLIPFFRRRPLLGEGHARHLVDKLPQHPLRHVVVGDDALTQGADGHDVAGGTAQHGLGIGAHAEQAAVVLVDGHHRGLIEHNALALDIYQYRCGTQVDTDILC